MAIIMDEDLVAERLCAHDKARRAKWAQACDLAGDQIGRDVEFRERRLRALAQGLAAAGERRDRCTRRRGAKRENGSPAEL
jgi:hypothetical protein